MASTFSHDKIFAGPAAVNFDGDDLGVTIGPAEWTPETSTRPRNTSRWGETNVDIIHTGEKHSVKVVLAESAIAVLEATLPEGATTTSTRYFGRVPGGLMSTHAGILRLRPVAEDASDDASKDFVFYKAVVTGCDAVGWSIENERTYGVTFEAMIDDDKDDGKKIGYINGTTNAS